MQITCSRPQSKTEAVLTQKPASMALGFLTRPDGNLLQAITTPNPRLFWIL